MGKPTKNSPIKGGKKNEKPKVGCGIKNPMVVRHNVPARNNQLSQHNISKLQTGLYSGPPTVHSSLKRGIGSGMLHPKERQNDWQGLIRDDQEMGQILNEQRRAREMLHTLACEVNGLNKDREHLRRATEMADRAMKKTVDYLDSGHNQNEGYKITTDGARARDAPEEPFLKVLSPSKQKQEGEGEGDDLDRMRTPTRKTNIVDEDYIRDSERVLEMSPPIMRYNPSLMQHTFELNLDGITLQELQNMKIQNEGRLANIEKRFFDANEKLERDVANMTEFTKDEQYLIKINNQIIQIPINSFAEINSDNINFDTNESDAGDQRHGFSKRLIYELKFEKFLKKKIREEIVRRDRVISEKYIAPEERLRLEKKSQIEEMVQKRLNGKTLTPEEAERLKLHNQAKID